MALRACALGVVFIFACMSSASAVDVVNRDKVPREIIVNSDDGQSTVMTVQAHQKLENVCKACIVLSGITSVEANGSVTVLVEGGKVSIGSRQ